jgi:hypothetical protein
MIQFQGNFQPIYISNVLKISIKKLFKALQIFFLKHILVFNFFDVLSGRHIKILLKAVCEILM